MTFIALPENSFFQTLSLYTCVLLRFFAFSIFTMLNKLHEVVSGCAAYLSLNSAAVQEVYNEEWYDSLLNLENNDLLKLIDQMFENVKVSNVKVMHEKCIHESDKAVMYIAEIMMTKSNEEKEEFQSIMKQYNNIGKAFEFID